MTILIIFFALLLMLALFVLFYELTIPIDFTIQDVSFSYQIKIWKKQLTGCYRLEKKRKEKINRENHEKREIEKVIKGRTASKQEKQAKKQKRQQTKAKIKEILSLVDIEEISIHARLRTTPSRTYDFGSDSF